MTNKNVRNAGLAIIVGTLALGAYWYLNQGDQSEKVIAPAERPPVSEIKPEGTGVSKGVEGPEENVVPDEQLPEDPIATTTEPEPDEQYKKDQELVVSQFKSTIKLKVDLPENMNFVPLDLEDGMEVLYGTEPINQTQMAVIAAKRTASPKAIVNFLNESKDALPMLRGQGFKVSGDIQKLKAPKSTGLGNVTLIPGQQKNGKAVWAAYIERTDGAGSYLFLMQAQSGYFDQNEEGLEAMLKGMKANP